jgi:hypothetical protein
MNSEKWLTCLPIPLSIKEYSLNGPFSFQGRGNGTQQIERELCVPLGMPFNALYG